MEASRAGRRRRVQPPVLARAHSKLGLCALFLNLLLLYSSSALASLKFCNATPEEIQVALAFQTGAQWHVKGWTTVSPVRCAVVYPSTTRGQIFYFWAHMGTTAMWGGYGAEASPWQLCVLKDRNFDYVLNGQNISLRDGPRPCADYGEHAELRTFDKFSSDNDNYLYTIESPARPGNYQNL